MASVEHPAFSVRPISVARSMTPRASKFTTPPPPASYVARPRLEARLDAAATARLTVVSGRAGAGKTALLSNWISTIEPSDRAWITLDADDNDAESFWGNVDATLQQLSRDARAAYGTRNEWRDAFLVLDDAHALTTEEARHNLATLVSAIPPWIHLVIACRGQVPISLWRIRAAGDLVEIDDADLRLSVDEAAAVVAPDATVSAAALDELHQDSEGWVTGLKLMTAPRHSSVDTDDALREFFLGEVFAQQTSAVQRFLMEVAWLDPLTPSLCQRVTDRTDAADLLRELDRANVFVTRRPGHYGTYVLHPQFRAVLRDELRARDPGRIESIHTAAARWYQDHDDPDAAVEHWLAAGNVTDAVRLLPGMRSTKFDADRDAVIRALLVRIHPSMGSADVWRLLDYATALATMEQDAPLSEVLDHVDASLLAAPDATAAFRSTFLRGLLYVRTGDVEAMVGSLERAQAMLDADPGLAHDPRLDAGPRVPELSVWLGHGYRWLERPRDASRILRRATTADVDRRTIHFRDSARAAAAFAAGHLEQAGRRSERALERATQLGMEGDVTTRAAHQVIAGLLYEHDELGCARGALEKLTDPAPAATRTDVFALTAQIQLAEVLRAEHDVSAALEMLFRMRQQRTYSPGSAVDRMLRRATVLSLLAIGRIDAARITLGPPPYPDALAITAALVELTDGEPDIAFDYLDGFRVDTPRRILCASLLHARIAAARGNEPAVVRHLRRSLRIARQQGFVRTVVQLAPDLIDRLPALCSGPDEAEHVANLRRANGRTLGVVDQDRAPDIGPQLSVRELEVLTYLPTQLSAREIAETLHVSFNTVKTHMQNVYRKLGCESREAAVERARRLHLLR